MAVALYSRTPMKIEYVAELLLRKGFTEDEPFHDEAEGARLFISPDEGDFVVWPVGDWLEGTARRCDVPNEHLWIHPDDWDEDYYDMRGWKWPDEDEEE